MRHRSIRANGLGALEAERVAMDALTGLGAWEVRPLGEGRIAVGRTYRPTWALVAAILTFPIIGLGLLFLFVKRTDAGDVVVVDGPVGSVVTVPPVLAGPVTEALEAAFARSDVPVSEPPPVEAFVGGHDVWAPAPAAAAMALTASPVDVLTAPDRDLTGDTATVATTARRVVSLRFPEGTLRLPWDGDAVLGRDPITDGRAQPLVVPGDNRSVSRSHLALSTREGALTATDLRSTNGTTVAHGEVLRPLRAGEATPVPVGATVYVGECSFEVLHG